MTFYLPPEWHPQDAVMLTWPHKGTDWAPFLAEVEPVYVNIAKAILARQSLLVVCHDSNLESHVKILLEKAGCELDGLLTIMIPNNDTWARDHGPITVLSEQSQSEPQTMALDFTFNGWGGKYESALDNAINQVLVNDPKVNAQLNTIDLVLEGGGIEVDGQGHLLTTEQCLLNPNRNSELNREQIESRLTELLGSKKVLWLKHGELEGDDTDSHIDTLARFAPNNTIVYVQCLDEADSHFASLNKMEQELKTLRNLSGEAFSLIPLPHPKACFNQEGERLPATYANFLVINGAVLFPTYGQPEQDEQALSQIKKAFPHHEILAIDCLPLINQFGSLHCISMQLPQGFMK